MVEARHFLGRLMIDNYCEGCQKLIGQGSGPVGITKVAEVEEGTVTKSPEEQKPFISESSEPEDEHINL